MNALKWYLSLMLVLGAGVAASCGDDDESDENGKDSDTPDGGGDECGAELGACCEEGDQCQEGLDPVVNIYDQSCLCQKPCTYQTCTAGNEDGYCSSLYGTENLGCVNDLDVPPVMEIPDDECTVGEVCTSGSGATEGTMCLELPDPWSQTGETVIRCVVPCEEPPTGCEEGPATECTPFVEFNEDGSYSVDYTNSHCAAPYTMK